MLYLIIKGRFYFFFSLCHDNLISFRPGKDYEHFDQYVVCCSANFILKTNKICVTSSLGSRKERETYILEIIPCICMSMNK